jgi:hypothetical protein
MRTSSLLSPALFFCLTACATTDTPPSIVDAPPTDPTPPVTPASTTATITITSTQPLALVAYREVSDPVWHLAHEQTSGNFTASVRGPYWVTAVCEAPQLGTSQLFSQVWRPGRTLDDPHELAMPFVCAPDAPQPLPELTGMLVQPSDETGSVALSGAQFANLAQASTQQLPFSFLAPKGTYTMYGFNADRIAIRHGVVVDKTTTVPALDLATEGRAYVDAVFSVVGDPSSQLVRAVTRIEDAHGHSPFTVASAPQQPFTDLLIAPVVPNELMIDDNQTVSVQTDDVRETVDADGNTVDRDENLAARRPWRIGDATTFVEPAQITGAAWSFDGRGQLTARWQALPTATSFTTEVSGESVLGNFVDDVTEVTPAFIAATGLTSTVVDTTIPGFQADWIVDYRLGHGAYTRTQFAQNVTDLAATEHGPIFTSDITETVSAPAIAGARSRRAAPVHLPRIPGQPFEK